MGALLSSTLPATSTFLPPTLPTRIWNESGPAGVKKKVWFFPPLQPNCWIAVPLEVEPPAISRHLPLFALSTFIGISEIGNFGASNVSADCRTSTDPSPLVRSRDDPAGAHAR